MMPLGFLSSPHPTVVTLPLIHPKYCIMLPKWVPPLTVATFPLIHTTPPCCQRSLTVATLPLIHPTAPCCQRVPFC